MNKLRFPLADVDIEISKVRLSLLAVPIFEDEYDRINQNEITIDIPDIVWFYIAEGKRISIWLYPEVEQNSVELYLNGSAYGCILHQRKIMPIHGSCFNFHDYGVMLCGESGAGKSSLTASFCLNGSKFLTDDVTPVVFSNEKPFIWAMSDRIKLWDDSLNQLNKDKQNLQRVDTEMDKFYFPVEAEKGSLFPLNFVLMIVPHDSEEIIFEELKGTEKFEAIRNEIYRWEFLQGMPETEAHYFQNLIRLGQQMRMTRVFRPQAIAIETFRLRLEDHLLMQIAEMVNSKT